MTLFIPPNHVAESSSLPKHHLDPSDRMLVGQARVEKPMQSSVDAEISNHDVPRIQAIFPA